MLTTRFSFPLNCALVGRNSETTVTVSIMWERDECSFMLVAVEERLRSATAIRSNTAWMLSTGMLVRPERPSHIHSRDTVTSWETRLVCIT